MGMTTEDNVAIFNFFSDLGTGGADGFLFLASHSSSFVFFTLDAEGRVGRFKDEAIQVGAAAEELVGAVSSGVTDAVTLSISSGATLSVAPGISSDAALYVALSVFSGATSSVALVVFSIDTGAVSLACVGGANVLDGGEGRNLVASLLLWSSTTFFEASMKRSLTPQQ